MLIIGDFFMISTPFNSCVPIQRAPSIHIHIKDTVMLARMVPLGIKWERPRWRWRKPLDGRSAPKHTPNDICRVRYWSAQNGPSVLLRLAGSMDYMKPLNQFISAKEEKKMTMKEGWMDERMWGIKRPRQEDMIREAEQTNFRTNDVKL